MTMDVNKDDNNRRSLRSQHFKSRKTAHSLASKPRTKDIFINEDIYFSGMMLSGHVLKGLHKSGFKKPSPIQLKAIPLGRCGLEQVHDLVNLSRMFCKNGRMDGDIDRRADTSWRVVGWMWTVAKSEVVSKQTKMAGYKSVFVATLFYGYEVIEQVFLSKGQHLTLYLHCIQVEGFSILHLKTKLFHIQSLPSEVWIREVGQEMIIIYSNVKLFHIQSLPSKVWIHEVGQEMIIIYSSVKLFHIQSLPSKVWIHEVGQEMIIIYSSVKLFHIQSLPSEVWIREVGQEMLISYSSVKLFHQLLDLVMQAKSGTGKTCVFTILALEMLINTPSLQVLVLAPTREIAVQITHVIRDIGQCIKVKCFLSLHTCDIEVTYIIMCWTVTDSCVSEVPEIVLLIVVVVDCYCYIINIRTMLPDNKQMIAASATYPNSLEKAVSCYMRTPTHVSPNYDGPVLLGLRQFVMVVPAHTNVAAQVKIKLERLMELLSSVTFQQCVVFSNYQTRAESICNRLNANGWPAMSITGSQDQYARLKAITCLREFRCRVLLSTDLTSRGIDAENVNLIVNFDVPYSGTTYLHRIGRAGRYGSHGISITLVAENKELLEFQQMLGSIGGNKNKGSKDDFDVNKLRNYNETVKHLHENNQVSLSKLSNQYKDCDTKSLLEYLVSTDSLGEVLERREICDNRDRVVNSKNKKGLEPSNELNSSRSEVYNENNNSPSCYEDFSDKVNLTCSSWKKGFSDVIPCRGSASHGNSSREEEIDPILNNGGQPFSGGLINDCPKAKYRLIWLMVFTIINSKLGLADTGGGFFWVWGVHCFIFEGVVWWVIRGQRVKFILWRGGERTRLWVNVWARHLCGFPEVLKGGVLLCMEFVIVLPLTAAIL
uniref:RNA helicase n=1 Tax=Timema douglasi TaxID=61478 RepID=A0A7R8VQS4_TIMDO|nr:unnamed protein product [Timema douglasi]